MKMIGALLSSAVFVAFACLPSLAQAQTPAWFEGRILTMWSDPDAIVLSFGTNGPCGTDLFNISKSNANFSEMAALMLTAAASGRTVEVYVTGCNGTRNVVSHGNAHFQ